MTKKLETITISAADGISQMTFVPARGGAASSLILPGKKGPKELLYLHDFFWDETIEDLPGGWPFCFPICARLERQNKRGAYLYDGKIYEMKIHGFSWYEAWSAESIQKDSVTLVLRDNEKTRQQYPFSFEVKLKYQIANGKLTCEQTYRNLSDQPMPYYAGFHPYFLTPPVNQGKETVKLNYEPKRRFVYNKDLTDLVGETHLFKLPTVVTSPEINEQLTQIGKNKTIFLEYPDGDVIQMTAKGVEDPDLFPYVQLYTMPEKPFICIEPWMAFPNAMNTVSGVRWLAPGASEQGILTLSLR